MMLADNTLRSRRARSSRCAWSAQEQLACLPAGLPLRPVARSLGDLAAVRAPGPGRRPQGTAIAAARRRPPRHDALAAPPRHEARLAAPAREGEGQDDAAQDLPEACRLAMAPAAATSACAARRRRGR